ncbi:MAG: hypothetical protein LAO23_00140 [Acidobacteriia bacterium]|jgi:hypothetical protein|nr:hypothetical protein [Terriglobia bacterium]
MLQKAASATESAKQSGLWDIIPSILWVVLALVALVAFRKEIQSLLQNFSWRLRTGAALKLFSIELGQSYVSPSIDAGKNETALVHRADENGERWREREQYYKPNRNIHLVHRLAPSNEPGMLYDIQLYVVAHKDATLSNLSKVEYYFGRHWGNQIFTSIDRARGFPITTSAYGAFMCTAKLYFSDGERVMINRYVDFEMGAIGTKL